MANDYNNIKQWLTKHLEKRGWSIETFSRKCDLSRAMIYFYMEDRYRPSEEAMARICKALDVPLLEGLKQYTPKPDGRKTRWAESKPLRAVTSHRGR